MQELRENVVIPYEQDVGIGLVNVEKVENKENVEKVGSYVCSRAKYVDLPVFFLKKFDRYRNEKTRWVLRSVENFHVKKL